MEKKTWYAELLKHAALLGLFVLLPLLVAGGLGYHTLWLERESRLQQTSAQLETSLSQVRCEAETEVFLKKLGRGIWHLVGRSGFTAAGIAEIHRSLSAFVPVDFDLYVFDKRGQLATPTQVPLRSRFLGARLWEMIGRDPIEQSEKFQKLRRQLKTFLGNEFRMAHFLDGRDSVTQIVTRQKPGLIYWVNDSAQPERGMMLIFWTLPELNFRLQHVMSKMRRRFSHGLIVSESGELLQEAGSLSEARQFGEVASRIVVLGQKNYLGDEGLIWGGRQIDDLWVVACLPAGIEIFQKLQNYLFTILFIAGILALLAYHRHAFDNRLFLPIRLKLLALFLVAVISPVMGFAYLGYRYLSDREATLLATVTSTSRRNMVGFDETFRKAGEAFIDEFREMGRLAGQRHQPAFRSQLEPGIRSNDLIIYELRNASSAELLFSLQNELVSEGMREVSDAFARFCLDARFGSNLTDTVDPLLETAVRSPEAGFFFLFNRPDEVHRMFFGPVPMFIYWNVDLQQKNGPGIFIYILQSASRLVKRLLQTRLHEALHTGSLQPYTLVALENRSGTWLPDKVRENRPLRHFADRLLFSDKPEEVRLVIGDEEYLILGQRSIFAPGYSLFSFYPYRLITEEISRLRRQIVSAIVVFILLAFMAAWLLSDIFLQPVTRLGDGVAAIKSRNTDFRIVPVQHDEFGDLAISFNHMIADLKEMKLAQDVQESLLPAAPPQLAGYRLAFANRMASAVGGDYFDVLVPDHNTAWVIIGDVTGHGVSSALVMAMAKAIVYQVVREKRDLISLFADLNRAIHAYFSKPPVRKMITFFAATIDLTTGKGQFANAGHNFPVLVRPDGDCIDLESVHLPIGALKNIRRMVPCDFIMQPGDTLVFYTDGLIEVASPAGEQYGYQRFKKMLTARAGLESEKLADDLLASYDAWLSGGEPDDDVTLVILQRQADA